MRRSRGEFDESSFNLSECDIATTKLINRDVLHFLQSIVNDWNHDLDDCHHAPQFGARQTTRVDGSMVNSVVIPTAIKPNQFQRHYEKLPRNMKKHVDKNVQIKKSMSCNCTTTTHQINDSFSWCRYAKTTPRQQKHSSSVLCNTSLFCSSGFNKECNIKGCPKVNKCRQRKFKKCHQGEQNLIYLTNWPFVHPPNATNSTKMLIAKPFDGEQQSQ